MGRSGRQGLFRSDWYYRWVLRGSKKKWKGGRNWVFGKQPRKVSFSQINFFFQLPTPPPPSPLSFKTQTHFTKIGIYPPCLCFRTDQTPSKTFSRRFSTCKFLNDWRRLTCWSGSCGKTASSFRNLPSQPSFYHFSRT